MYQTLLNLKASLIKPKFDGGLKSDVLFCDVVTLSVVCSAVYMAGNISELILVPSCSVCVCFLVYVYWLC